jgi:hypothetical protein
VRKAAQNWIKRANCLSKSCWPHPTSIPLIEGQLLPKILPTAKRTTLYCSQNDWALYASDRFNDGPRAGDWSDQVIVAAGLDTVDASEMDTELLGHSYYGSCMPLIEDVRMLLTQNLPPQDRSLLAQETEQHIPSRKFATSEIADVKPNEPEATATPVPEDE